MSAYLEAHTSAYDGTLATLADVPRVGDAVTADGVLGEAGFTDDATEPLWKRVADWEQERRDARALVRRYAPCAAARRRVVQHFGDYGLLNVHLRALPPLSDASVRAMYDAGLI